MADRQHPQQIQVHTQHQVHPHHQPGQQHRYDPGSDRKSQFLPQGGPSASKVLAFLALLPVGGSLLGIAGLTFIGSLIGLALLTPLFIIFSPVLVPAAIAVALAVTGFLASGAFGLTGLSSLSWVMNYFNQATGGAAHQIDEAKRRMQDMAVYMGQKTKDVGETIQTTAQPQQTGK